MGNQKNRKIDQTRSIAPETPVYKETKITTFRKPNQLCFIVTKNRRRTWAEDLYACEMRNKADQIFH